MKGKSSPIIIGTRGSELALWQAHFTKSILEKNGLIVELKIIKTKGDATQQWNVSFDKLEGKGFFTKELEDALLSNEIDLAVHSCKDLPTDNSPGLTITAFSERANPFDLLLVRKESVDETKMLKLKQHAVVGTSSARRKAQLLAIRPDIELKDMRGNVPTRVNKLKDRNYDAIILASAGLERLKIDLEEFEKIELKAPMFIPAPAQGVLAFQIREIDVELKQICTLLNDQDNAWITTIERQLLHDFQGGCQIPLGVYSRKEDKEIRTWVSYADAWKAIPKRIHFTVSANETAKPDSRSILDLIKNNQTKTIFISSEIREDDYLKRVAEAHQYDIRGESFIEFKPVQFEFPFHADWLFFSSKNGVNYFFNCLSESERPSAKIATINPGTASAVYELGLKVDFTGEGSDLQKIAGDFDEIAYGRIVFPQAKVSMQTIQKALVKNRNIETLVIYENQPKQNISCREEQIMIFTSPMGAEAYFSQHAKKQDQTIISIGKTTTGKLNELGIEKVHTAYEPSQWCLIDEIFTIK